MSFLNEEALIIDEIATLLEKAGQDTSRLRKLMGLTTDKESLSAKEVEEIEAKIE